MNSTSGVMLALALIAFAAKGWLSGDFRTLPRGLQLLNVVSVILIVGVGVLAWLPVSSGIARTTTIAALATSVASRVMERRHRATRTSARTEAGV